MQLSAYRQLHLCLIRMEAAKLAHAGFEDTTCVFFDAISNIAGHK